MNTKLTSHGACLFCGKTFTKAGMGKHLKSHFASISSTNKKDISFLLKVEPDPRYDSRPFFLFLWVNGKARSVEVDDFLRAIWLECCGHLSKFVDQERRKQNRRSFGGNMFGMMDAMDYLEAGNTKKYEEIMEQSYGEIPMSRTAEKAMYEGQKIEYEYDFGSSTDLLITVEKELNIKPKEKIILLSRNEPLKIMCDKCGIRPATQICPIHDWEYDSYFCDKCTKIHAKECPEFEEYAKRPVVNSPRMGVCGYGGGSIDTERDGVYKE